jgi:hypothetical protein
MPCIGIVALCYAADIVFLMTLLLVVGTPTPEISWRLFAVNPDVAEILTVVVLHEASLGHVGFDLDESVGQAGTLWR